MTYKVYRQGVIISNLSSIQVNRWRRLWNRMPGKRCMRASSRVQPLQRLSYKVLTPLGFMLFRNLVLPRAAVATTETIWACHQGAANHQLKIIIIRIHQMVHQSSVKQCQQKDKVGWSWDQAVEYLQLQLRNAKIILTTALQDLVTW